MTQRVRGVCWQQHSNLYFCSRCLLCYACDHELVGPKFGDDNANSIWWWKCYDKFEKPSYRDFGQFAPLAMKRSHKKVRDWTSYAI